MCSIQIWCVRLLAMCSSSMWFACAGVGGHLFGRCEQEKARRAISRLNSHATPHERTRRQQQNRMHMQKCTRIPTNGNSVTLQYQTIWEYKYGSYCLYFVMNLENMYIVSNRFYSNRWRCIFVEYLSLSPQRPDYSFSWRWAGSMNYLSLFVINNSMSIKRR